MPHVRVLRPFNNGSHHAFARPGDVLTVSDDRATDLIRNHLVEPCDVEKAAPIPDTKPAPTPANKTSPAPAAKPGRKPLGRPRKVR
ncbi:hypothetical protein [Methylobacterium oryzae]|uniref:hypothetical protein n=1 Tax=Methylobacterium oryzae TaxID=334852 RepID=UPI001F409875|nr:hypothetical protein [Methylobacterium oryzae]UIN36286.1 hypothetical protein LXM90_07240 [Methylobacterium oryzae]